MKMWILQSDAWETGGVHAWALFFSWEVGPYFSSNLKMAIPPNLPGIILIYASLLRIIIHWTPLTLSKSSGLYDKLYDYPRFSKVSMVQPKFKLKVSSSFHAVHCLNLHKQNSFFSNKTYMCSLENTCEGFLQLRQRLRKQIVTLKTHQLTSSPKHHAASDYKWEMAVGMKTNMTQRIWPHRLRCDPASRLFNEIAEHFVHLTLLRNTCTREFLV